MIKAVFLFLGVTAFFIFVAVQYGPAAISAARDSKTDHHDYTGYFYATATLAVASFIFSTLVMRFLLNFSDYVIKGFLLFAASIGLLMSQSSNETNNLSLYGYIIVVVVGFYTFTVW